MNEENRPENTRREAFNILFWLLLAVVLLMFVSPGLQESPYNSF
jgi:predicted nucleic acid-binding Zn ribbon protein